MKCGFLNFFNLFFFKYEVGFLETIYEIVNISNHALKISHMRGVRGWLSRLNV